MMKNALLFNPNPTWTDQAFGSSAFKNDWKVITWPILTKISSLFNVWCLALIDILLITLHCWSFFGIYLFWFVLLTEWFRKPRESCQKHCNSCECSVISAVNSEKFLASKSDFPPFSWGFETEEESQMSTTSTILRTLPLLPTQINMRVQKRKIKKMSSFPI